MANPFENKPNADALAEQAEKYAQQAVNEALEANNYAVIKQAFKIAGLNNSMHIILNAVRQKLYESHGVVISDSITQDKHNHDLSPVLDQELADQKMADLKNQDLIDKIKSEYSSVNFSDMIFIKIREAKQAGVVEEDDLKMYKHVYVHHYGSKTPLHIEDYD